MWWKRLFFGSSKFYFNCSKENIFWLNHSIEEMDLGKYLDEIIPLKHLYSLEIMFIFCFKTI
jgi:hypothetical protein